ncbi:MAG TPA: glycosyltransferase [Gemmatimonadaceae bacterium]|nr:glycosyltransferase [Gemmatimonadaceae bacterium]
MNAPQPSTMYVTYTLAGGGAERLLTNLILQHPAPERVSVVTMRPGGVFRSRIEEAGVEVVDLGMTQYHHALAGAWRLARLMRAQRPEIVHGWDYFSNLLVFVAHLFARNGARIFWAAFGTGFGPQKLKWRFRAVVRLNAWLSRWVDGMAYNGPEVREYHRGIGFREPRSALISNATDAGVFRHDAQRRETVRAELGIAPDDVVVVVVARVDPQKDWPAVCAAMRGLPGVVTLAVGDGTAALPPQAGLIRLGWRDDVVSVLSAADVFLLASAFGEGTSLALGEAMLCGLPCIVTDVGGNGRLVGDAGIVIQPGDAQAIRDAVIALARDPERRRALGRLARSRAAAATPRDTGIHHLHAPALAGESS